MKNILISQDIEPTKKMFAIVAMGDLALSDEEMFLNNMEQILPPYFEAA
jgi:hypothetical protein